MTRRESGSYNQYKVERQSGGTYKVINHSDYAGGSDDLFYTQRNEGKFVIVESRAPSGYYGDWTDVTKPGTAGSVLGKRAYAFEITKALDGHTIWLGNADYSADITTTNSGGTLIDTGEGIVTITFGSRNADKTYATDPTGIAGNEDSYTMTCRPTSRMEITLIWQKTIGWQELPPTAQFADNGRKASGYNIGKVFDITQTRGRPVPPPANYQVDELVAAAIESSPVPIQISDSLPDGIQAQYVSKNRTIYVRNGMDAGTTLCAVVRECAQADFHKDYTYNRQAYAAPSYCAAYMVAHRYGLDTAAFNFDRVVALYGNLGKEQQRGFLTDVNIVGGGLLRSLSRTLAVQSREPPTAEYAVAVPSAKKQSRQRERG